MACGTVFGLSLLMCMASYPQDICPITPDPDFVYLGWSPAPSLGHATCAQCIDKWNFSRVFVPPEIARLQCGCPYKERLIPYVCGPPSPPTPSPVTDQVRMSRLQLFLMLTITVLVTAMVVFAVITTMPSTPRFFRFVGADRRNLRGNLRRRRRADATTQHNGGGGGGANAGDDGSDDDNRGCGCRTWCLNRPPPPPPPPPTRGGYERQRDEDDGDDDTVGVDVPDANPSASTGRRGGSTITSVRGPVVVDRGEDALAVGGAGFAGGSGEQQVYRDTTVTITPQPRGILRIGRPLF